MTDSSRNLPHPNPQPIPREHWDHWPWNRWTFQNVRQCVPTAEVWRGEGPTWELPEHPTNFDSLLFETSDGETRSVLRWFQDDHNDGFIVLHQGAIVYERYCNGMTDRSLHLSQSVAKSVTSCVAGVLVGKGLLDPAGLITDYLPELETTAYKGALLRYKPAV